jgi:hypothetical protein
MTLATGTRLGPYEILSPLGAGGMGEVYRAHDARLAREVAVKALPPSLAADADRRRRFEQEAKAAARINHPNILQVYDVGEHDGQLYVVTELLEGGTLRERMAAGPIPARKAVEIAIALARGLAAAHDAGIVHRDLKPENVFVTLEGRVKILDFGLAKLAGRDDAHPTATAALTLGANTAAGVVLGTMGYMSPGQVRGQIVDHRSDLFAFGAIAYEMLSGRRAFHGESPADTMSAILREDPPPLDAPGRGISPVLERIVRHCLEKSPGERFRSAHDLAFQLEAISGLSGDSIEPIAERVERSMPGVVTEYRKITFREGTLYAARFASDGETVIYSAAWDGGPVQVYMKRVDATDSVPLPLPPAQVQAISRTGEIALLLRPRWAHNGTWRGVLAVAPMFGGAPRELEEDIHGADFSPSGRDLAVTRDLAGRGRLEFPIGRPLYENSGHVSFPRVSPRGDRVAFLDHPFELDDRGAVAVVDLEGRKTTLTEVWRGVQGLTWSPSGDEIWFTARPMSGGGRNLYAVTPSGDLRTVASIPGLLRVFDHSSRGHVLLSRDEVRVGVRYRGPEHTDERDLSWLDWTLGIDLTPDGATLLMNEQGGRGSGNYLVGIRKTDDSPVVQLGEGRAKAISPDGRWVLAVPLTPGNPIVLLPTGAGRPRTIAIEDVPLQITRWLPDGSRILCVGSTSKQVCTAYLLHLQREIMEQLPLDGADRANGTAISSDGRLAVVSLVNGDTLLLPLDGGSTAAGPRLEPGEVIVGFGDEGRDRVIVEGPRGVPLELVRMSLSSGEREPWKKLMPANLTGVVLAFAARIAQGGDAYAYNYVTIRSELYVAEGLR